MRNGYGDQPPLAEKPVAEPFSVLLVGEDSDHWTRHTAALRDHGVHLTVQPDFGDALQFATASRPDLVVVDADHSQGEILRRIRALRAALPQIELPVLLLTSLEHLDDILTLANLSCEGCLVRPVESAVLVQTLLTRAARSREKNNARVRLSRLLYEQEREHLAINQHAIVSVADRQGRITHINDRFCDISGYARDELIGSNHRIVKSGRHDSDFYRDMWATIAAGRVWQGEICNRRKDGGWYWVESTIVPFVDAGGKPYQYVSIRTDITRVKEVELSLRRQRDMQELVIRLAADFMAARADDMDAVIDTALAASGAAIEADRSYLFLLSADGTRMSNTHEWCAPGIEPQRDKLQDFPLSEMAWWWGRIRSEGRVVVADTAALPVEAAAEQAIFRDQQIRSLFAYPIRVAGVLKGFIGYDSVQRLRDWQGEEINLLQLLADMVGSALARRESEAQTEQARERLRRGQMYANIGTWDWDIESGELFWTERIPPLFGYPEGELETSYDNFLGAVHPDDRPMVEAAVARSVESRAPYDIEHRVLWPDGTVRWLQERGGVMRDRQGRPTHMLGVVQDITERVEYAAQLRESEADLRAARDEADRASRAKSEFLSSMSHELRTPLNAILGFAQLMEYDNALPAEQADNVQEILKAGRHLLDLIGEILDLARIEAGRLKLSMEAVEVRPLIDDCIALMAVQAEPRGIRLLRRGVAGATVRADRTRLKQVLLNLLSNAVKYNRDQGEVILEVSVDREADTLRISIQDTGRGLSNAQIARLFEPFERLAEEGGAIEGAGIGLTITRHLVELMGGMLGVHSEPGAGSNFWIELPLQVGAETDAEPANPEYTSVRPIDASEHACTLLYIEDNPVNIRLVASILERRPCIALVTAHHPDEGYQLARQYLPDLVLMDINLPGQSGYELMARFRADPLLAPIPVIAVTANAMPRDVERGRRAGFVDYLTKPLDIAGFLRAVDVHLSCQGVAER